MEVREFSRKQQKTCSAEQREDLLKKARKEHDKMVKGVFEFIDAGHGWFEFVCRFFPGEPLRTIRIQHGEQCEIPLGIARLLNNSVHKIRTIGIQQMSQSVGSMGMLPERGLPSTFTKRSRLRFTNMEYMSASA